MSCDEHDCSTGVLQGERGATTVEYAIIIVIILLTVFGIVMILVNPTDQNSVLPMTYTTVGNKVGNFGIVNIATN